MVREKMIEGIADLRDESDRDGVRVVVELKRDAMSDVVLNQLFRHTPLQTSFGVNMLALNGGRPELMSLRDIIAAFIAFREEVITRRTIYLLGKARERAHILLGLAVAVANIDAMIELIRNAPDPAAARAALMARLLAGARRWRRSSRSSRRPATAARRATAPIASPRSRPRPSSNCACSASPASSATRSPSELDDIVKEVKGYLEILGSRTRLLEVLRDELQAVKQQFATPRKTVIEDLEFEADIEELIQREDMVVTVSHAGYIKRVPLSTYRAQRRGGRGRSGMAMREEDFVSQVFVASTHAWVLFFTSTGRVYKLKVYRLPIGTPQARGKAFVNLLPNLAPGEGISTVMPLPEDESDVEQLHRRVRDAPRAMSAATRCPISATSMSAARSP